MKGLPSHFGTEQDILNCMNVNPAGTKNMLQQLLDGRTGWFKVKDLLEGETGQTDALHEVRVEPMDEDTDLMQNPDAPMKRVQYEKRDDPLSQLFRLKLTVQKVNDYIADCDRLAG